MSTPASGRAEKGEVLDGALSAPVSPGVPLAESPTSTGSPAGLETPPGPSRVYCAPPEWQDALLEELQRVHPTSRHGIRSPGWLESYLTPEEAQQVPALAFVSQSFDQPQPIEGSSINAIARAAFPRLVAALKDHQGPWRLQVSCVDYAGGPVSRQRCQRIEGVLWELLKEKQRRLARTRVAEPHALWQPDEALVQLALETSEHGWLSVLLPDTRIRLRRILSRFPGGDFEIEDDLGPPSSAFKKVVEGQAVLGRHIRKGEKCVDLGGCPGGWTYIALKAGAHVLAVDRSPLRDDLMAHRRLEFVQGDAFRFAPITPVDWLLCDVIAFPQRSIAMLDQWLSQGWCKHFIVTLKFKGKEDYAQVDECKRMLANHPVDFLIRHLNINRNEVTVMGSRIPTRRGLEVSPGSVEVPVLPLEAPSMPAQAVKRVSGPLSRTGSRPASTPGSKPVSKPTSKSALRPASTPSPNSVSRPPNKRSRSR